jgi:hypothetical protein
MTLGGYALCGTAKNHTCYIAIQSTSMTDPVIGACTTIRLNAHQNRASDYSPFDSIVTDYNATYVNGTFYLYTRAAAQALVSAPPPTAPLSPGGKSLEIAMSRSLGTPAGGMRQPRSAPQLKSAVARRSSPPQAITTTPNTRLPITRRCRCHSISLAGYSARAGHDGAVSKHYAAHGVPDRAATHLDRLQPAQGAVPVIIHPAHPPSR